MSPRDLYRKQQVRLAFDPVHIAKLHELQIAAAQEVLRLLGVPPAISSAVRFDGRRALSQHDAATLAGFCDMQQES